MAVILATNFCFLLIFSLGNEKIFVCCSLSRWGKQQIFVCLPFLYLGKQQIFVFCSLLRWGSNKFLFVRRFCVWASNKFLFAARFRVGGTKKFLFVARFCIWESNNFLFVRRFRVGQATVSRRLHPLLHCAAARVFQCRFYRHGNFVCQIYGNGISNHLVSVVNAVIDE